MPKNDSPKTRYTGPRPWLDKDWLYNEYVVKDRSTKDIANEYGCKRNTIQVWLIKHGIKKEIKTRDIVRDKPYQSYEYLYEEHIVKRKPIAQIARECKVSADTIRYNCDRVGIKHWRVMPPVDITPYKQDIIFRYVQQNESLRQIALRYKCSDRSIKKVLEKENIPIRTGYETQGQRLSPVKDPRLSDPIWLEEARDNLNLNYNDIAKLTGVNSATVRRAYIRYGLVDYDSYERRYSTVRAKNREEVTIDEAYGIISRLCRQYHSNHLVPKILRRDKFTCRQCGKDHTLEVHHIIPYSTIVEAIIHENRDINLEEKGNLLEMYNIIINDKRFIDENNLITLCKDCHNKISYSKMEEVENEE